MSYKETLSEISSSSVISRNVTELRAQKNKMIHELAFLQATISCEDQEKINESYSGQTAAQFPLWAGRLLVLGINRCFDGTPPRVISALQQILGVHDQIVALRRKAYPDWTDLALGVTNLKENITKSLDLANEMHKSKGFAELRVFRTEELAHSLDGISKDRGKYGFNGGAARPSFSVIMSLAEQTILLIDRIISYWEFHIENSQQTLSLYAAYARTYWKALPNFSDVEDISIVSDAF